MAESVGNTETLQRGLAVADNVCDLTGPEFEPPSPAPIAMS